MKKYILITFLSAVMVSFAFIQSEKPNHTSDTTLAQLFAINNASAEVNGGDKGNPTSGTCTITVTVKDKNGNVIETTDYPGTANNCPSGNSPCTYSCTMD